MRLRPHHRQELLRMVESQAPHSACRKSVMAGKVAVLGGFDPVIEGGRRPGWIVRVETPHRRVFLVAVIPGEPFRGRYRVVEVDGVPWENWIGQTGRAGPNIYDGDKPQVAERARREKSDGI